MPGIQCRDCGEKAYDGKFDTIETVDSQLVGKQEPETNSSKKEEEGDTKEEGDSNKLAKKEEADEEMMTEDDNRREKDGEGEDESVDQKVNMGRCWKFGVQNELSVKFGGK